MKNLLRRKSKVSEEQAAHQQKLMRAIGALDPYADADPGEVEKRIRSLSHGRHRDQVA